MDENQVGTNKKTTRLNCGAYSIHNIDRVIESLALFLSFALLDDYAATDLESQYIRKGQHARMLPLGRTKDLLAEVVRPRILID